MTHLKTFDFPTGKDNNLRANENPTLNENLLVQVMATPNVQAAWQQVCRNKGVAGIDGISIDDFPEIMRPKWRTIKEKIISGKYRPQPVLRVRIPKDDGSERLLGIPCVIDRLIQQSIVQVLSPLFDPTFSEHSYGFRPQRSAKDAVIAVQKFCQQERQIAVDIDLSKFFDRVNHDFLMTLLGRRIRDKCLLKLIGSYLRAGVQDGKTLLSRRCTAR
jgi:RNA-directed DNA polymerase